jgi:hypothetical protein
MNIHRIPATFLLWANISVVALFCSTPVHSESIPTINADKSYQFTRMPDHYYYYESQQGPTYQLTPWVGQYVVILTRYSKLDSGTMEKILRAVDSAYVFYLQLTGASSKSSYAI